MNSLDLSTKQFVSLSERILKIVADYLDGLDNRKIPAGASGAEIERIFRTPPPEVGIGEEALKSLHEVTQYSRA